MMWRLFSGSLRHRKSRLVLAILSVALGSSLVAALLLISMDIPRKANSQLRAYGANLIILPRDVQGEGAYLQEGVLSHLEQETTRSIEAYTSYLYTLAGLSDRQVVVAGTWLEKVRLTSPWWKVEGTPADGQEGPGKALVGVQLARQLKLEPGTTIELRYGQSSRAFTIRGIVETGASEDSQVFIELKEAQELTSNTGKVSLVQVSALSQKQSLSDLAKGLGRNLPGAEVRVVGQIARAESLVLSKVQLLMALVAGLVLGASGLAIASTMTTSLLERKGEIGLMKALGAAERRIAWIFGAEALAVSLVGGVAGYAVGYSLAQLVGRQVFAASVSPRLLAFSLTLMIAVGVTCLSAAIPLWQAMKIAPSITLRGE